MAETQDNQPTDNKDPRKTVVAIRYDIDRDKAPLVVAAGRGLVADEIVRIAEENKIPLYEDPELAKLLAKLELDTEIPSELYTLVAEVLFFVYKLDRMAEKREKVITKIKAESQQPWLSFLEIKSFDN